MKQDRKALIVVAALVIASPLAWAASEQEDVNVRLQRIEQILNNRQQFDTTNQLIQLQDAVEQLNGQIDVQSRTLKEIETRQQTLYKDIDARLQLLEQAAKAAPVSTSSAPLVPNTSGTDALLMNSSESSVLSVPNGSPGSAANVTPNIPINTTSTTETPAAAPATPSTGTTAADAMQEQASYQQAYQFLLDKNYSQSVTGFNNYLSTYPQGRYRANAYYWLGEIYLVQKQPQQAQQAFNTVITDYPKNPKASDAMLKLGYSYAELGDTAQAKTILNQVIQKYPNTSAAALAQARLDQLS